MTLREFVCLAGDSNLRYTYFYLLELLGKLPHNARRKLRDNMRRDQLHFQWAAYEENLTDLIQGKLQESDSVRYQYSFNISELWFNSNGSITNGTVPYRGAAEHVHGDDKSKWRRELSDSPPAKDHLLILNSGWWPLKENSFVEHLLNLSNLEQTLVKFKGTEAGRRTRILWMTSLPVVQGFTNDFAVIAANQFAKRILQQIEIFDQFSLIYPRKHSVVCAQHYLCLRKYAPVTTGTSGMDMISYFFREKLCCCQEPLRRKTHWMFRAGLLRPHLQL